MDSRGRKYSSSAIGGRAQGYNARKVFTFIRKSGGAPSPSGADPVGHMLYLMNEQKALVDATRWFMEPIDYLTMRFTGIASATHASRLAMWMTDVRHLSTYDYDSRLLALGGLEKKFLPPLQPFGSIVGTVMPNVASELGLSSDVAVVTGIPDLHAAAIGSGSTGLYDTHLALSTTSWISCPIPKKKTDINHSIAAIPGLSNDSYLIINSQDTGAKALEWLQGVLAGTGERLSFDALTALAATSEPGARGVLFTPWLAGERSPVGNSRIRAGFTNLSLTTSSADLVRAVMEGVAANSSWLLGYVEKFTGQQLSPIKLLGGGAQSSLWCQIYADTLGRDVVQVAQPLFAQMRGAAMLASATLSGLPLDSVHLGNPGVAFSPNREVSEASESKKNQLATLYKRDRKWMKGQASVR
jgi:xylulokinase